MADKPINREENVSDNGMRLQYVNSTHFVQDPSLQRNTDVQNNIDLYYTSLDDSEGGAQLFVNPGEAKDKADSYLHRFPNHIVKFFMFYYEPVGSGAQPSSYKRCICQVVPGEDDPKDANYRLVKRKNLKSIYDKIDFIMVYRPKNTIKWYKISKEELQEELAVIREFYGLTNFPNTTGDFYFSKKIGKWLATRELNDIIADYEKKGKTVPVFYPDKTSGENIPAQHKTWLEILIDWVGGLFEGAGEVLGTVLEPIKNVSEAVWEDVIGLFKDEDGDWIPDTLEKLFSGDTELIRTLSGYTKQTSDDIEATIEKLKKDLGIESQDEEKDLMGLNIDDFKTNLHDMINSMKTQGDNWWSSWWRGITQGWKDILHKLGID